MRSLLALAVIAGLVAPAAAEEKLKVGDKAPALKATKWLQGAEVKEFATGKAYVVEFWATWCGPCIVMMPHMAELQAHYKDKVTFIGHTSKDDNNTQEKVAEFVKKRGPKLGYTFAYADERAVYDAWMTAAGQQGIPCCFVVDTAGKIAYIGHPMFLGAVLPKVVAGKWTAADVDGLKAVEKEVDAVFEATGKMDPEAFLKALADFEAKHPDLGHIPYFDAPKLVSLLKAKKTDEAKKMAEALLAKGIKTEDPSVLRNVSGPLTSPFARDNKELVALGVKAAEEAVKIAGDKDAVALYFLAEAYFASGDKAKAKETGAKAVEAADGGIKKQLENLTKKYSEEKKNEKKDEKK
ncbi:TlpA family protein disulfide reductase [Gemmata sp. JC673]|uniref:TlpA family protein disulfide reductase n=1 Tax=Gemmata algarum TaxID=2975278 RepID=A0ABU5EVW8_9BACT|nr:TlpA disulfide reductase family protein [Gemmata algarum]MDY3559447.1 TlpA family protein disulfide reductase [Gemmata algarum]